MEEMESNAESKKYRLEDSEMWHAMALETCGTFLPSECPLVSHMIMSFQKHHSPAMTSIPENGVLDEAIMVLRPLNEVKMDQINYHQIIRSFLGPTMSRIHSEQQIKPKLKQQQEQGAKGLGPQSRGVARGKFASQVGTGMKLGQTPTSNRKKST